MATLPATGEIDLASLRRAAKQAITNGVVAANSAEQRRYWHHWLHFCRRTNPPLDPLFSHQDNQQTGDALECFAAWIREGKAGRGARVGAQTVQVALRAIGTKFELDHQPNPIYRPDGTKEYWKPLARMIEGYRRQDPPPKPKLAVPVEVATTAAKAAIISTQPLEQAINDLVNIAFYFLLRVGEYTYVSSNKRTRTIQFRVQDITLWSNNRPIPNTASLQELLTADAATLSISNQKNGTRGELIHHETINLDTCPTNSLARRIHHIMSVTNDPATPISAYQPKPHTDLKHVRSSHINTKVKDLVEALGYTSAGYTRRSVSSHSLRAGGAMAMKLNNIDRDTIKKFGRWSSDTFLMYIHEQISAFSAGVSKKMTNNIIFHNIAGPTLLQSEPAAASA
jgi:hypothetical protein